MHTPTKPKIIAVVNQKGGVGKTTTAVNLATAFTSIDKKILLIDLDPQGNASTGLGIEKSKRTKTSYEVLIGACTLEDAAVATAIPNLKVVPANVHLSGAEIELVTMENREFVLRQHIHLTGSEYDYVLIDCPPSLGLLTLNALVASDSVIVPLQCEFFALEGLSHLLKTVERVKRKLNPRLEVQGVVLTMYDKRNKLTTQIENDVRGFLGAQVYRTVIPRNVRMSEAPSHGKPALLYDFNCPGAKAYAHLASEVLRKEKRLMAA